MASRKQSRRSFRRQVDLDSTQLGASPNHIQVNIHLKHQDKPIAFPPNFAECFKEEYAIRYLEKIGASSSPENIAMILKNMPLHKCAVNAAWKSRGSAIDAIKIDVNHQTLSSFHSFLASEPGAVDHPIRPRPPMTSIEPHKLQQKLFHIGSCLFTFDDIKNRFLFPFREHNAEIRISKPNIERESLHLLPSKSKNGRHSLMERRASVQRAKCHVERENPPEIKKDVILQTIRSFHGIVPWGTLAVLLESERALFLECLMDQSMLVLIPRLAKYLYVVKFVHLPYFDNEEELLHGKDSSLRHGPTHLHEFERPEQLETLFVDIVDHFSQLKSRMQKLDRGMTLWLPLLLLALRVANESIFRNCYPLMFASMPATMDQAMADQFDEISRVLDPGNYLSRLSVLETTFESTQILQSKAFQRKKRQRPLRTNFYQTSQTLQRIFPEPLRGKTRQILRSRGGACVGWYDNYQQEQEQKQRQDPQQRQHPQPRQQSPPPVGLPQSREAATPRQDRLPNVSIAARLHLLQIVENSSGSTRLQEKEQKGSTC